MSAPKPDHLRQRRNKKSTSGDLEAPETPEIPPIPNPDKREWHELSIEWWNHVWSSPMSTRYLDTDRDGLGMVLILVDEFYKTLDLGLLGEIRLQEARFGLSPIDRLRLSWRVVEGKPKLSMRKHHEGVDPRQFLKAVN